VLVVEATTEGVTATTVVLAASVVVETGATDDEAEDVAVEGAAEELLTSCTTGAQIASPAAMVAMMKVLAVCRMLGDGTILYH
jgi:hypothetical protein